MYRTKQWRRAQKARIQHNYEQFIRSQSGSRYELPQLDQAVYWYDKAGQKRQFRTWADVHEFRKRVVGFNCENRKACSCASCGNPRKWYNEVTRQELKSSLAINDED